MSTIIARFIIQIAGKPVEKVDEALSFVEKKLQEEKEKFKIIESEVVESEFDEESKLYSGFIEVSAKFISASEILNFIVDYTPTSIEVEDPHTLKFDNASFTGILNDMSTIIIKSQNQIRMANATIVGMKKELDELKGVQKK